MISRARRRSTVALGHPSRIIVLAFGGAIAVGTVLLSMPWSTAHGASATFLTALFTATSAVCVTGLVTVDTGSYWSAFGQGVILLLIQIGGLGIMTMATLIAALLTRRMGLRTRLLVQTETKSLTASDIKNLIRRVAIFTLIAEAVVSLILFIRFTTTSDQGIGSSIYSAVFHAISAFNNAGFSLNPDSLIPYNNDAWILLTIAGTVIIGGLGFPVLFELAKAWRNPATWSILTRITLIITGSLLFLGTLIFLAGEVDNPNTLGSMSEGQRLLNGFFLAVMPRTAGFNSIDVGAMSPESTFMTDILMFIGAGSAGTAGGLKVTTFGVLAFILWAQIRGESGVRIGRRRLPADTERQAISLALLYLSLIILSTLILLEVTPFDVSDILFEAISATSTVGLSTGITPLLPDFGQYVIIVLMFIGRIGPLTVATALAMRRTSSAIQVPEERMIIG